MDGERLSADAAIRAAEFRAALRRFLRRSERIARSSGLTPQRYLLLLMIKGAPNGSQQSTVTELAERLQLAQSTVTELVRRAEEVGLVERETSALDGRVAHLRLSEEGERRLAQAVAGLTGERAALRATFQQLDEAAPQPRSAASTSPGSGKRRVSDFENTSRPSALTSNCPFVPGAASASNPSAVSSATRLAARSS
jgi:DNA-binding MarR family transcriptional regulator